MTGLKADQSLCWVHTPFYWFCHELGPYLHPTKKLPVWYWNNKCTYQLIFTFSKQAFNESFDFLQLLIASWMTQIWLTAAKLTNTLWKSNSFAKSDTGVVIDSQPHLGRTCKTSFLFAPLTVCVHTGCFAFPFYTPTKTLIQLHIKYRYNTVLFPKL